MTNDEARMTNERRPPLHSSFAPSSLIRHSGFVILVSPMRLIDLSQPVFDGCPNCPAHPPVRVTLGATHEKDGWRLELLHFASHTGSHVDAPLHKLAGGASLDDLPLDRF